MLNAYNFIETTSMNLAEFHTRNTRKTFLLKPQAGKHKFILSTSTICIDEKKLRVIKGKELFSKNRINFRVTVVGQF